MPAIEHPDLNTCEECPETIGTAAGQAVDMDVVEVTFTQRMLACQACRVKAIFRVNDDNSFVMRGTDQL